MANTNRPNILWICTDQQRWDTLGCHGNDFVSTPNLDRMAASGIRFDNAFCQSPVCTPSRASFLTSRYPRTCRARQNGQSIPADEVLVTRLLADSGYYCGLAGKLHISACHPDTHPGCERRINDGYAEFHWSHHPSPGHASNAYIEWLAAQNQCLRRTTLPESGFASITDLPPEQHQTAWCANTAVDFIERMAGRDQPWLFSVNIFDPHHPFDPPREFLEPYRQKLPNIPLPPRTAVW